jgi:nitroreductase
MDPIELLLSRQSHSKLIAPAPTDSQLDILFKAALRAPDHALLKPWRYRVFQGKSLHQLGEKFAEALAATAPQSSEEDLLKISQKPLRAPMVIVASVVITEHPKVPAIEQMLSGGASVQNLLMAAHFQGIGAMWRTGSLAYNRHLMDLLNFAEEEILLGFIYLGTEEGEKRNARPIDLAAHVTRND